MKLIVGLGNPSKNYSNNRHNVGYMVVDVLAKEWKLDWTPDRKLETLKALKETEGTEILLAKPATFMNQSGKAVKKLITHYSLPTPDLWVIYDDLDIALGDYKIQKGKGPKDHKGVLSIDKEIGSKDFWHVRVGVENRKSRQKSVESADNRTAENSDISDLSQIRDTDISRNSEVSGEEYVLQDFNNEELVILSQVIDKIVKRLLL